MKPTWIACVVLSLVGFVAGGESTPAARRLPGLDRNAIDNTVSPCQDFYAYACGRWLAANPLPPDRARWGRFDAVGEYSRAMLGQILVEAAEPRPARAPIEQQVGDYYASCADTTALNKLGAQPLMTQLRQLQNIRDRRQIPAALAGLHRTGAAAFFLPYSARDFEQSSRFILVLDEGELGLPSREYYLNDDAESTKFRRELLQHITRQLIHAGLSPRRARKQAAQVLALETRLAKTTLSLTDRLDPHQRQHTFTRAELLGAHPHLALQKYLEMVGVPHVEGANVVNPRHLTAVDALVATVPLEQLKTYLIWHLVREAAPFLDQRFIAEHNRFNQQVLGGQRAPEAREKECTRFVEMDLSHPLGRLYVERAFGAAQKERVQRMSREIRGAFAREIHELPWMTPETKRAAVAKLDALTEKIGYPDQWRDYSGLRIVRGDALGNSLRANEFELMHQLRRIGRGEDDEWLMPASMANAYYYNSANEIVFPAGILQPPFYDHDLDGAVHYGTLGTVIGHEITHGFDSAGREFDVQGNLRNWWQLADAAAFQERARCFVEQYSAYSVAPDVSVSGTLTLAENIADHGGMRIALGALRHVSGGDAPAIDGYTPLQRFFLAHAQTFCANITLEEARRRALADTHAPNRYRVNGVVSNFPEFAEAFQCTSSLPMVRPTRCRIW